MRQWYAHNLEYVHPTVQGTVLALVAALMTATQLPDRIINSLPAPGGLFRSLLIRSDGTQRNLCQLSGCVVAAVLLGQWIAETTARFGIELTPERLWQFGILMATLIVYTLRNPSYLGGSIVWSAAGYAALCYFSGVESSNSVLIIGSSTTAIAASAVGLLFLNSLGYLRQHSSFRELRDRILTEPSRQSTLGDPTLDGLTRAFVVPLCDLSLVTLGSLVVLYHLPILILVNFVDSVPANPLLFNPLATTAAVIWLIAAGVLGKQWSPAVTGIAVLPVCVSGLAVEASPMIQSPGWYSIIWAATSAICYFIASHRLNLIATSVARTSALWLMTVLAASCLWLSIPVRLAAGIVLASFFIIDSDAWSRSKRTWLAIAANIQLLYLVAAFGGVNGLVMTALMDADLMLAIPLMLIGTAISISLFDRESNVLQSSICRQWSLVLRAGSTVLILMSFRPADFGPGHSSTLMTGLTITAIIEFRCGIRRQDSRHIWFSLGMPCVAVLWLMQHGFIEFGNNTIQFVLLAAAGVCLTASPYCHKDSPYEIAAFPLLIIGQILPGLVALVCAGQTVLTSGLLVTGVHSLAMFSAAALYFHQALVTRQRRFALGALGILNLSLLLLCNSLGLRDAQFYMVPIGLSIIGFVELMKQQLPKSCHDLLRYIGALMILVSPTFEIVEGSWLHLLTLMVFSVVVVLLAIGLRLKALLYTGSAFLLADLVGMVVRSTVDHPNLLWVSGVVLGAVVITFAAFCENHRDRLLQRIRFLSAELAMWR